MGMDGLDQEVLDGLHRTLGNDDAFARIISMYLRKLPAEISELHRLAGSGDLEQLVEQAHRLKSSTAMVGATRLAGLLAKVEGSAREGDLTAVSRWTNESDLESTRVEGSLKARLREA